MALNMSMTRPVCLASSAPRLAQTTGRTVRRALMTSTRVVRAQADMNNNAETSTSEVPPSVPTSSPTAVAMDADVYTVFGPLQESINGRAAMLGFAVAMLAEVSSGQSVVSQMAGRYVNYELVEPALLVSDLSYGFVVMLVTLATFAPLVMSGEKPGARSFGPFTKTTETLVGRAAMLGFAGLVLVELAKGNTALF